MADESKKMPPTDPAERSKVVRETYERHLAKRAAQQQPASTSKITQPPAQKPFNLSSERLALMQKMGETHLSMLQQGKSKQEIVTAMQEIEASTSPAPKMPPTDPVDRKKVVEAALERHLANRNGEQTPAPASISKTTP